MKKIALFFAVVVILIACNDTPKTDETPAVAALPNIAYTITNVYPHDTSSFTEGFEYHDTTLYESTGEYSHSKLLRTSLKTGKPLQSIALTKDFFGEGITLLNDKIYQLTYKENRCFVYDAKTFKKLKEFKYEGEGWGMTTDGKELIMDNGSNNLFYRNPETFAVTKTVPVIGVPAGAGNNEVFINELEYVDGFFYANTYTQDFDKIVKIDTSGKVVGVIDLTYVLERYATQAESAKRDVLNGIAYNPQQKVFYCTGKKWPKVFEVKLN